MAVNTFTGATNNNWGTATNWSQGTVPVVGDGHVTTFDNTSPNCTVDASNRTCDALNFNGGTGYTNTITMTFQITVSGNITLSSGMGIAGTNTLVATATGTLTSNGKTWSSAFTFQTNSQVYTLADNWTVSGNVIIANTVTLNGSTLYCAAGLSITGITVAGTTNIELTGTGTWVASGKLNNNLTFNSSGTITLSGTLNAGSVTITYTAGTISAGTSTLTIASSSATLNTTGMSWANINFQSSTITLSSNLTATGNGTFGTTGNVTCNGFNLYVGGNFTFQNNIAILGTTNYIMNGTGTLSQSVTTNQFGIRASFEINTSGTITLGTNLLFYTGCIFTYTAGTVVTTGNTLYMASTVTLNTAGIIWNNISIRAASTFTNNSLLTATGTMSWSGTGDITWAGTAGFTVATLTDTTTNTRTFTLVSAKTYTITTAFNSTGATAVSKNSLVASTGGSQAILTLNYGATQDVGFMNATDIDSSAGQTIWSYKGTLSNTLNWNNLVAYPTIASTY